MKYAEGNPKGNNDAALGEIEMDKREKFWLMFTESGDPLAYIAYKSSAGKMFKRVKKHDDV